jgi:site-specific recombinase XerD
MRPRRRVLPSREREEYLSAMRQRGYTAVTMGCKNRYIDEFLRFVAGKHKHTSPGRVTKKTTGQFRDFLEVQRVLRSTKRAKWREICVWFEWLQSEGKIESNPFSGMKVPFASPRDGSD